MKQILDTFHFFIIVHFYTENELAINLSECIIPTTSGNSYDMWSQNSAFSYEVIDHNTHDHDDILKPEYLQQQLQEGLKSYEKNL